MLFNAIDTKSDIPAFEQIKNQVIYGIAVGALEVGKTIPSVRELAKKVSAHPNTVAKAFLELERIGVVETRRGIGMEVTPEGPAIAQAKRKETIQDRVRDALREAVGSGLPPEEIWEVVEEELGEVPSRRRWGQRGA
jgi:GntR family transcriptional regulator